MLENICNHQLVQTYLMYTPLDYMEANYTYDILYILNHSRLDYNTKDNHSCLSLYTGCLLF
uniref:Uncharacterized protein n=1 Tax=Podoviridae sp. ctZkC8 TaxID=2825259 RepID=A0A8S5UC67_9CAUD|nr:MAG TPA: hypothetical protein [Podoviridae sp. ctZkC8]